jgi:hypothetical protein
MKVGVEDYVCLSIHPIHPFIHIHSAYTGVHMTCRESTLCPGEKIHASETN